MGKQKHGNNSYDLKTIEEDDSSSFITINSSDNEESKCDYKENRRRLKMNSLNNSREFNVCFDEDISLENSILFYDPTKGGIDQNKTAAISNIPKNGENVTRNFSKNKKKIEKKQKSKSKNPKQNTKLKDS